MNNRVDVHVEEKIIDIWGDEGGLQLTLHRLPSGKVLFGIDVVGGFDRRRMGEVTIAKFRLARIAAFLTPEETEAQHEKAVEHVRNLIGEATAFERLRHLPDTLITCPWCSSVLPQHLDDCEFAGIFKS